MVESELRSLGLGLLTVDDERFVTDSVIRVLFSERVCRGGSGWVLCGRGEVNGGRR